MKRRKPQLQAEEEDPIAEVRKWRAQVFKEAGGTIKGLIALMEKPKSAKSRVRATKPGRNGRATRRRRAA